MGDLPDRARVEEAWAPFVAKYPEYLDEANWDSWFMQDKIVHAYMTGRLVDRERVDYEAFMDELELRRADGDATIDDMLNVDDLRAGLDAALGSEGDGE